MWERGVARVRCVCVTWVVWGLMVWGVGGVGGESREREYLRQALC